MAVKRKVVVTGDTKVFRKEMDRAKVASKAFGGTMRGTAQSVAVVDGPLGGVSSRISALASIAKTANPVMLGFGASIAALSAVAFKSVRAFNEYEQQQLKVEQLVRATGGAAGFTANELAGLADQVALSTLASVGDIQKAIGVLQTFRTISGDTFRETIVLAQDMAAVFGGAAADKALQLGKALESPTDGLTALKRSGVSFTDSERELIKTLEESGQLLEAQGLIIEKVKSQIGGSGAAVAGGLAGATDTLAQRWDELLRGFGKTTGAASIVESASLGIANSLKRIREAIDPTTESLQKQIAHFEELLTTAAPGMASEYRRNLAELQEELLNVRADRGDEDAINQLIDNIGEQLRDNADPSAGGFFSDLFGTDDSSEALLARREQLYARLRELDEQRTQSAETQQELREQLQQQADDKGAERAAEEAEKLAKLETDHAAILHKIQMHQFAAEEAEQAHQARITKIQADEAKKRLKAEEDIAKAKIQLEQAAFETAQAFFKEGSKAHRALLVAQKASALARAYIALQEAIAQANTLPWPQNLPAIAQAVQIGAGAIASIRSVAVDVVAHGGLTNAPREMTALIQKDERILSPRQNQDFTGLMDAMKSGELAGAGGGNINIYGDLSGMVAKQVGRMIRDGTLQGQLNRSQNRAYGDPVFKGA